MKNDIELLCPAGDFECLKAAVQNGADSVYFGANLFNARASAENFNEIGLIEAINYCALRNVKTNLKRLFYTIATNLTQGRKKRILCHKLPHCQPKWHTTTLFFDI